MEHKIVEVLSSTTCLGRLFLFGLTNALKINRIIIAGYLRFKYNL